MNKEAQLNLSPKIVAEKIAEIIKIIMMKMKPESRLKSFPKLKNKLKDLNSLEMSMKGSTGGAAIGTSISVVKNILNGKDPYYIQMVIKELSKRI